MLLSHVTGNPGIFSSNSVYAYSTNVRSHSSISAVRVWLQVDWADRCWHLLNRSLPTFEECRWLSQDKEVSWREEILLLPYQPAGFSIFYREPSSSSSCRASHQVQCECQDCTQSTVHRLIPPSPAFAHLLWRLLRQRGIIWQHVATVTPGYSTMFSGGSHLAGGLANILLHSPLLYRVSVKSSGKSAPGIQNLCLLLFRPHCWIQWGLNKKKEAQIHFKHLKCQKKNCLFTSAGLFVCLFVYISCCCHWYRMTNKHYFLRNSFQVGPRYRIYGTVETLEQHLRGIALNFALGFIQS